ncbi:hypothetical protein MHYP_G00263440 [Metynnis hypsauchen]
MLTAEAARSGRLSTSFGRRTAGATAATKRAPSVLGHPGDVILLNSYGENDKAGLFFDPREIGDVGTRGEGRRVSVDQSAGPGEGTEERPAAAAAADISVSDSVSEVGAHGVDTERLDGSRASSEAHEGEGGSETALAAQVEAVSTGDAAVGESVETHSDRDNEVEWGMWWDGKYALSHGSSLSAGVAVFFSRRLGIGHLHVSELEQGRLLLVQVEDLGYERHLFVLRLREMDLSGTSVFYQSVLRAWSLALRNTRSKVQLCSLVEEEPLFYNPLIPVTELTFKSIRLRFQRAGITKLGDLRFDEDWKSGEVLRAATGIMSVRLLQRIVGGVASSLPTFLKEALQHHSAGDQETFPSLPIAVEMGDHQEEEGALLSFRTPQLAGFAEVSKKALYSICVKVLHRNSLDGLKESRWLGLLAPASSPQGSWRSLYKPPIEKRAGDLQWRIVHGAVATNRHVAHIDPTIGSECPFCGREETVEHLFLHCIRLTGLLNLLKAWCCDLGILWTYSLYVFGPKYVAAYREKLCLLNFLIGQGKLAVWLTRKNKLQGSGTLDPELLLRAAVRIRFRIEYAYFKTTHNLPAFHRVWLLFF